MIANADAFGYADVMNKFVVFQGHKYRLTGRYYRAENWGKGPTTLHRARWTYYRGEIPAGFDVHHKDGDGTNNRIGNLELIERGEHARQHTLQRIARGELKPPSDWARAKAAEWHGSKAGLEWHSKHGKLTWEKRVRHRLLCQECGAVYHSPYPNKSKFCHLNCKMAALRKRLRL